MLWLMGFEEDLFVLTVLFKGATHPHGITAQLPSNFCLRVFGFIPSKF